MTASLGPVPELMARLGRLAEERHTDRDTLSSEVISAYLEREESTALLAQTNAAYTDAPNNEEAVQEKTSLARSRRLRRLSARQEQE